MRCIFCKQPSDASRGIEHVIPESLGNHTLVLPPGVVCDGCNNYLGRKVEKPFLDSPLIRDLRHRQGLLGKRGRPLTMRLTATGGAGTDLVTTSRAIPSQLIFDHAGDLLRFLAQPRPLMLSEESRSPSTDAQLSRLLAKIALGYMATCLMDVTGGIEYLVDEENLDPLRDHARRGTPAHWPTMSRRIYSANSEWRDTDIVQRVWEALLFADEAGCQYFVMALFGWEVAIHIGEPDISGYRQWLLRRGGTSPLFDGSNTSDRTNQVGQRHMPRTALLGYKHR